MPPSRVPQRVWVASEGPLDTGSDGEGGALAALVRGSLPDRDLEVEPKHPKLRRHGFNARQGAGSGHKGHAYRAYTLARDAAREAGEPWLVYVHDLDEHGAGARSRHRQAVARLRDAVDDASAGQDVHRVAVGVAIPMVEAWLLGDAAAFEAAFGARPDDLPRAPESDTTQRKGRRDAKSELRCALASAGAAAWADTHPEQYALLAARLTPETLARSCPLSFAPFLDELRRLGSAR